MIRQIVRKLIEVSAHCDCNHTDRLIGDDGERDDARHAPVRGKSADVAAS